jgi:hypothetical protein
LWYEGSKKYNYKENKIYCIPEEDDAVVLYPEHDKSDNPIILEITLSTHQNPL